METSLKLALPNFSLAAPKNLNCPKFGGGRLQPLSPPPPPARTPMHNCAVLLGV